MQITSAYRGMGAFAAAAKATPDADRQQLWQQLVIDPYWDLWAAGS